jgi:hippurate hydrolase
MLAGAARVLCANKDKISGTIVFMFQPGEEGYHGAKFMLEEEGLIPSNIDSAFGIHVVSNQQNGIFACKSGAITAAQDRFEITVIGAGGHAALPWSAVDPIPVASQIILSLQNMVTRRFSPLESPVVVTVGKIVAGTANNIIPTEVLMSGTVRTFSEESRKKILEEITKIVTNISIANNCTSKTDIISGYPVTVNNEQVTELARKTVTKLFGSESYVNTLPTTGAEDFSYVLQKFPGCFIFLGVSVEGDPRKASPLHSEKSMFDEGAMLKGIMMHCGIAIEMLSSQFSAKL